MYNSRYNPDDIEQAKRDMAEQRHLERDYQEAKCESQAASAMASLAERPTPEDECFTLESRLGPTASLVEQDGVLFRAGDRCTDRNEDGGISYLAEYRPVEHQDKAMALFLQARVVRHYNPMDPLEWRIEKWLEFDVNEPVATSLDFAPRASGYELVHRFRHGNELYRKNNKLLITFTHFGKCTYHTVVLSDIAVRQEQVYSLDLAIECAIQADQQYRKAQQAECDLRRLLGMTQDDSISW